MGNGENAWSPAEPNQHEAILLVRGIWIAEEERILIEEDDLRICERDSVLSLVRCLFLRIRVEPKSRHAYIVTTL